MLTTQQESTLPTAQIVKPPILPPDRLLEEDDLLEPCLPKEWPQIDHIVTEDDTPVDNLFSAKQQRLLVESLYNSWCPPDNDSRSFLADANIGIFHTVKKPPIVPDVLLSLDVSVADNWWEKQHRAYFVWEYGKPPDIVIEIVSNKKGSEEASKLKTYARMHVPYYVIFDPTEQLHNGLLRLFELRGMRYHEREDKWLPQLGIGLKLWHGCYEQKEDKWLRWCDKEGNLILTGAESIKQERQRAEQEHQRAEQEHQRAEQALSELEQLKAHLQTMGINPNELGSSYAK